MVALLADVHRKTKLTVCLRHVPYAHPGPDRPRWVWQVYLKADIGVWPGRDGQRNKEKLLATVVGGDEAVRTKVVYADWLKEWREAQDQEGGA
jgi:hypothetical protein